VGCPLCELDFSKEKVYFRDAYMAILRTKSLKGHRERIMVTAIQHWGKVSKRFYNYAVRRLIEVGMEVFSYTSRFVVMDGTYASIKDHWHLVASDLDPNSEDYDQILKTKWLKIVNVGDKLWWI